MDYNYRARVTLVEGDNMPVLFLVDDDMVLTQSLKRKLEAEVPRVTVVAAMTSKEAIQAAQQHDPAVLITNFSLPDGNAIDLHKALQEQATSLQTIMYSAFWPPDGRKEAESKWAFRVVDAPFAEDLLVRYVKEALIIQNVLAKESKAPKADFKAPSAGPPSIQHDIDNTDAILEGLKKVLIVDDSNLHANMCSTIFAPYDNCGIEYARSGLEALDILNVADDFDLIITDINMPHMDGISLIKEMKKQGFQHLPLIVVSTEDKEKDILKALKLGARGYVTKPWRAAHFRELIVRVLSAPVKHSRAPASAPVATFNDYQEKTLNRDSGDD
jgi:DNA-binding NtrC family response regulator